MKRFLLVWACLFSLTIATAACHHSNNSAPGPTPTGQLVPGSLKVLQGATEGAGAAFAPRSFGPATSPAEGYWLVSPDSARVTLLNLAFTPSNGVGFTASLGSSCTATYERATASLSQIIDCPFSVAPGTYYDFGITLKTSMEVLVNDSADGLFTDPTAATLMSTTPPGGGAAFVTVDFEAAGGPGTTALTYALPAPFVVTSGQNVSVSAVADMIQTVQVVVSNGVPAFRQGSISTPVILFGSPAGVAKTEYYSEQGTAGSYDYTNPPQDGESLRVYYSAPGVVAEVIQAPTGFSGADGGFTGFATAADPAQSPDILGSRAGGFAGIDSAGDICWAQATSFAWTTYTDVYRISEVATLGSAARLVRMPVTTTPQPSSGATYASGCPVLASNGGISVTLAGH